jgi:fumarate hydratase subunit beta
VITQVQLPLKKEAAVALRAGDEVEISGMVLTGRDQACARLFAMLSKGEKLPVELNGSLLYFVGPTPAPADRPIGSAGPTTSGRMNPFLPALLSAGLSGFIGKGFVSPEVHRSLESHHAVYFGAIGGTGALLSTTIRSAQIIAFPELLSEAIMRLELVRFPSVVLHDTHGGDLYQRK